MNFTGPGDREVHLSDNAAPLFSPLNGGFSGPPGTY